MFNIVALLPMHCNLRVRLPPRLMRVGNCKSLPPMVVLSLLRYHPGSWNQWKRAHPLVGLLAMMDRWGGAEWGMLTLLRPAPVGRHLMASSMYSCAERHQWWQPTGPIPAFPNPLQFNVYELKCFKALDLFDFKNSCFADLWRNMNSIDINDQLLHCTVGANFEL